MKKLIIISDLGRVRALTIREGSEPEGIPDHLVEYPGGNWDGTVQSRGDTVTDQSGRFGRNAQPGMAGGMSIGEEHQLDAELERKNLERVVAHISEVVEKAGCPPTVLAAPQAVLKRVEEGLSPAASRVIVSRVGADLTKEPVPKLEKRFL